MSLGMGFKTGSNPAEDYGDRWRGMADNGQRGETICREEG